VYYINMYIYAIKQTNQMSKVKQIQILEQDFNIQMKRSKKSLSLGDIQGAERWNGEAERTVKKMNELFKKD